MKNYSICKNVRKQISILKKHIQRVSIVLFTALTFTGCKKWIAVDPPITQVSAGSIYANNASASSVMTGVYDQMISSAGLTDGTNSISFLDGLAADELTNYTTNTIQVQFYQNALTSSAAIGGGSNGYFWTELYKEVYACNAVLVGLNASSNVTQSMKQQLTGEAKFMRAFLYFYAVNLYGDVPLVLTTDYQTNKQISRASKTDVFKQIIQDLLDAQSALSDHYVDQNGNITTEKIRPNKWAATALLARAYLYLGDWKDAEIQATNVIGSTTFSLPTDLTQVFKMNNSEAILQFHPVLTGITNTQLAYYFVLTSAPGTGVFWVAMSPQLQNAFEPNDKRFSNWVGSLTTGGKTYLYPYKYRANVQGSQVSEYLVILRLAEQYLIRAEARAQQNNASGAQADLNTIRTRAGLPNTTATDQASLLTAVLHERQVELFTEWGHRWFDLIRTGNINSVMGSPGNICAAKGGTWSSNSILVPLPQQELLLDPNLKQNPGY
ncbi:RagB/SusD family nutrient uptake outer membrane protein [Mucilaginibacter sp. dw_454]|uniref:RagB/SusD family nutrient uptake outer membrane protein n=1 Tax=Mucilaginibacter sp. dw_454 TaxID=2720079 RepID=UPI001BD5C585|nr:RagB/SusD family nutrient uptake outer membrane protein [Mucilaginibacter sp. dw_454]